MPFYEYQAEPVSSGCTHCSQPFSVLQKMSDPRLTQCPQCGGPVTRIISPPAIGRSASSLDHRAKQSGFHKLKRLGKGEYEKQY
jgi:putative FmdB family regulatory protein